MPVAGAVIGAAGSVGGGMMGASASQNAAQTQAQAAMYATDQQRNAMQEGIQAQAYATMPGRNIGTVALYQLASMLGIDPRSAFQGGQPGGNYAPGGSEGGYVAPSFSREGAEAPNSMSDWWSQFKDTQGAQETSDPGDRAEATARSVFGVDGWENIGNFFGDMSRDVTFNPGTGRAPNGAALIPALPAPGAPGDEFGFLTRAPQLSDLQMDPSYGFRRDQNLGAIENSGAARGMQLSGSTLKDLSRFSQDFASQEYGNAYGRYTGRQADLFNRMASLAGIGQTASQATGATAANAAANFGQQAGNNAIGMGNALAAGQVGSANAMNSGIQGATNSLNNYMLMQQLFNNGGSSGNGYSSAFNSMNTNSQYPNFNGGS